MAGLLNEICFTKGGWSTVSESVRLTKNRNRLDRKGVKNRLEYVAFNKTRKCI
ncbi:predicted protein [Sclerotinia sclerotiorum 1980 UF-70]|uniref:Uncharacterized protein n=1 Tax=Sclerotinia sclerotiorum (strain ATCC 18683 / 1980 / Ss-1) TaxID=665079 RepID=A7EYU3_SCLS1|nr:predicted protein [Sclerotinia sclerotiorum 1980 UF-70]EDN94635.1 predicted protein [Sclerotinia sclerotiorum 1980 UF-70]